MTEENRSEWERLLKWTRGEPLGDLQPKHGIYAPWSLLVAVDEELRRLEAEVERLEAQAVPAAVLIGKRLEEQP